MVDLINVDYNTRIPNNVNLAEDRRVLKALERWHPGYLDWWMGMGPGRVPGSPGLLAHRGQRRFRRLGQVRTMSKCRTTAGAFC